MEFLGNDEIEFYAVNMSQKAKKSIYASSLKLCIHAHVTNEFTAVEFQSSLRFFASGIHLQCASLTALWIRKNTKDRMQQNEIY